MKLRLGPRFVAIDPFTPNERWVPEDQFEPKDEPKSRTWTITKIDHKRKTITLE